jgi:hypothetical protein
VAWLAFPLLGLALYLATGSVMRLPFPPDTTPEGAYMRIAKSVDDGHVREIFAYLETDAEWAAYSVKDARALAFRLVQESYPEPQRSELMAAYEPLAKAPDGADVFALFAEQKGWAAHLRRDLSGVASVEIEGERASVVTARGTRYAFRRRENGIWGLTMFTAQLLAESERAARDLAMVKGAAEDYGRGKRSAP